MDSVFLYGLVVIFIKEHTSKMKDTVMGKWYGLMEVYTQENGLKEYNTVLGKLYLQTVHQKKEYLKTIFLNMNKKKIWIAIIKNKTLANMKKAHNKLFICQWKKDRQAKIFY